MPELLTDRETGPQRPDWLAGDAVRGEPVSGGKEQGRIQVAGGDLAGNAVHRQNGPGGGRKPKLVCDEDTILKIRHLANIQGTKEEGGRRAPGQRAHVFLISAGTYKKRTRRGN